MAKKRPEREKKSGLDPGMSAGVLAALVVLGGWGLSLIEWGSLGGGQSASADEVSEEIGTAPPGPQGEVVHAPASGPSVLGDASGATATTAFDWQRDALWKAAIEGGDKGLDLLEETRRWHEDVGGDPFRYRYQMEQVQHMLEQSVEDLEALRKKLVDRPSALREIDKQIARYSKPLVGLRKES